ncbi:MAG: LEPR-XLL domain-containing protein, partial [Verrucomicrobiales bacterium]|nr:LEPR-XLL domain-containing protein [Verrucomicrobiales bacterium]
MSRNVHKPGSQGGLELEQLEPRVLLSGVPLPDGSSFEDSTAATNQAAETVAGPLLGTGSSVADSLADQSLTVSSRPIEDIFDGVGEALAEVPFEVPSEAASDPGSPADDHPAGADGSAPVLDLSAPDTGAGASPSVVTSKTAPASEVDASADTTLATATVSATSGVPPVASAPDTSSRSPAGTGDVISSSLVETLDAANGPPAAAPTVATASPRVFSPGHSPGKQVINGPEIWSGGESYIWEINDVDGLEGADPGWDYMQIDGSLQVQATAANRYVLTVKSLTLANAAGNVADFNNASSYTWRIASAAGGITGFDATAFQITTASFSNPLGTGTFIVDLSADGHDLLLRYRPSLPSATGELNGTTWTEEGPFQSNGNRNT